MRIYCRLFFILMILPVFATAQDAKAILEKIDRNMSSGNRIVESSMIIHGKRSSRTIESRSWTVGSKKSFSEYLSPASEKGTKMLKLENQLWIYSPSTDRIIQIAGHMLRQSVMGSDLSYEDMMNDRKLTEMYDARVTESVSLDGRDVWLMELTAKVPDVAYYSRKMWIDKEKNVPVRQELYAKSGQLLKRMESKDIRQVQGRWYPFTVTFRDMLKQGDGTEFRITSIKFDQDIPEYLFSKAALKQ